MVELTKLSHRFKLTTETRDRAKDDRSENFSCLTNGICIFKFQAMEFAFPKEGKPPDQIQS
jgi:hypothetical protein